MFVEPKPIIRDAVVSDATQLAKLIDIAGEGIPSWLWRRSCIDGQTPLEIGVERAKRVEGGFSFANARVADNGGRVVGMELSYPIDAAPEHDPNDLPQPIAPFVELEAKSVGTWYVNALAVFAGARGAGLGSALMRAAEQRAKSAEYPAMSIQVYSQNHGAVKLYQALGYRELARAPVREHPCQPYYDEDVVLLVKQLRA